MDVIFIPLILKTIKMARRRMKVKKGTLLRPLSSLILDKLGVILNFCSIVEKFLCLFLNLNYSSIILQFELFLYQSLSQSKKELAGSEFALPCSERLIAARALTPPVALKTLQL